MLECTMHSTHSFEYEVRRSKRRRTMAISIESGAVIVRVPARTPDRDIRGFVEKEKAWILRKLAESRERMEQAPAHTFVQGEILPYIGYRYALRLETAKRTRVVISNDELIVFLPPGFPARRVPEVIREWYRVRAREVFEMRAAYFSGVLGLEPPRISVRGQKRRWGSCTSGDRINLNWKLMTAPVGILDYVVAHELCHLIHRNHGREFWSLLSTVIPEYKECRKWLRDNGHKLGL